MDDAKLTLFEHLSELRTRLWKVVLAALVLGGVALIWARDLFNLLMRPVLAALPEGGRSLVYTSGIEEINVLLKVGLYAGLALSTPVALYQLWLFVAPGLLKHERRAIAPFVVFGTAFFVAGALFCYFLILPSMFKFLLAPGEARPVRERIVLARGQADDAARLLFLGEPGRGAQLARAASDALAAGGDGRVLPPPVLTDSALELTERSTRLGRLLDAAIARGLAPAPRRELARSVTLHHEAEVALAGGRLKEAALKLEDCAAALGAAFADDRGAVAEVWGAHRHLAAASNRLGEEEWTRPMLSMREQLSLVLMLEIAFGAIFELPLIMALLAAIGLLRYRLVARYQRYAILGCVVGAALLTPTGDAINLALMAVPMVVCFEIGVVLVWVFERRRAAREAEDAAASADPG